MLQCKKRISAGGKKLCNKNKTKNVYVNELTRVVHSEIHTQVTAGRQISN